MLPTCRSQQTEHQRGRDGHVAWASHRSALRLEDDLASAAFDRFRPDLASSIQRHPLRASGSTRCTACVERAVAVVLRSTRVKVTPPFNFLERNTHSKTLISRMTAQRGARVLTVPEEPELDEDEPPEPPATQADHA